MNVSIEDCTDFIVKVKNNDDLQAAANAERDIRIEMYEKGYRHGSGDMSRMNKAIHAAIEKDFQQELETIDDVMSSPFDVEHQ